MKEPLHILFADDNEDIRVIFSCFLAEALSDQPYELQFADDGDSALLAMAERDFDLVFFDIAMPGRNGFSCLEELKRLGKLTVQPVIAVSAHTTERDKAVALEAGFVAYLCKPFTPDDLRRIVERYGVDSGMLAATA